MMSRSVVAHKRNIRGSPKVKTGCATCRIRKVKCDEEKPYCQRCVKTGRRCDGYESNFRLSTCQTINRTDAGSSKSDIVLQPIQSASTKVAPEEIELLNHYFSIKSLFNVNLGCDEEARQVLQASLVDPSIRHALSSLRALREDLEASIDNPAFVAQPTPNYSYGLQQYSMALEGVMSALSSPSSTGLKSALFCCQIFISIEQVQGNYAGMAQHITRGLKIIHEYRARPYLDDTEKLLPAHHNDLPLLDVFVIKLFSAPCKFAEPPATPDGSETTSPESLSSPPQHPVEYPDLRTIAPNMRTELTRIATSTLKLLDKVLRVASIGYALQLQSEKVALLDSLKTWLTDLDAVHVGNRPPGPESVSVAFLRMFHSILRIVLLGTLGSSSDLDIELRAEHDRLQDLANGASQRIRDYKTGSGISNDQKERSKVRWALRHSSVLPSVGAGQTRSATISKGIDRSLR